MADDLAELEPFLATYLNRLGPAQRRKVTRKIGQELRKANAKRIAANVEPDGPAMEPRKPRPRMKDAKGKIRRTGKMFPRIRLAKAMRIRANTDEVELAFTGGIDRTARAHQFGLTDVVGKTATGKVVKTRYPARRLLGFGPEDLDLIMETALKLLED